VIYITAALLLFLACREWMHDTHLKRQDTEARAERAKLLDRIQHPEIRQVMPGEPVEYETPKDEAEMAWVGQEVPEFVQVGDTNTTGN
jgi:hypothetical protein